MKTIFLFLVLVLVSNAYSQTASQYAFTNGYDGSLYDMATGSTQFTFSGGNGNNDDGRTAVTNIGFTFNFCGTNYTQFTINTNALMRLGGTQLSATNYGSTFPYAAPVLSPFGGDHAISSTGKIHYKLFGTAPARYLVVEWLNMEINYSSSAADGTFQVVLYETSNRIEFIYGSMRSGGAGTGGGGNTVRAGIGSGSTSNNFYAVHVSTNATSTSTAQSYTLPGANTTLTNLHNTSQGTRRYYRFQPPCNALSSAGTISGAQSLCNGGNPAAFTSTAASGGSNGFIEYQWESSTTSSSSGFAEISGATAETYDAPSGISTTTYYRRKARRCSVGSTWEQTTSALTVTVAADANAPSATKSPNSTDVGVGVTLTLTSPTYGSQPGQSCGFEYRYSTNNGTNWTSWASSTPSFASIAGTNIIQIRVIGGCQSGCDASPSTSYSWTVTALANDECANSTSLPCATSNLAGTTVGSVAETPPNGALVSSYGVWYSFTGDGQQTTISSTAVFDHEMVVLSGSSCGSFTTLASVDNEIANVAETHTFTTTNTQQYYVFIAHYSAGNTTTGTFTISRTCQAPPTPPANDNPNGAIQIPVLNSITYETHTNVNATNTTTETTPSCASYAGEDVWFKVVVPQYVTSLDFDTQTGGVTDAGMSIYRGSIGSLTEIECDDDDSPNGAMSYISRTDFTPNETIYVRVWEYGGGTTGTFGISVTTPHPLPVELLYFKGTAYPLFNVVQWATASEHGSSHFDLQRSTDGVTWTHVATKQAAGNSTENINYSWIDYTERVPLYYYRLIQHDIDGKSKTYGPIVIYGIAEKRVVKLINLLGQEVPAGTTGVLFEVYEDGTLKKILR
jgi:hypothetical protein